MTTSGGAPPPRPAGAAWKALLWSLPLALYGLMAVTYVRGAEISSDEGFYCEAARSAASGRVPYSDFGYSQGPVVPYVNGALMRVTGFGLVPQRALNGGWALLGLLVLAGVCRARAGNAAALLVVTLLALSLFWVKGVCLGNTFALTSLFLALASASVLGIPSARRRLALSTFFGALATGCRLSAVVFAAVVWLFLVARSFSGRFLAFALGIAALCYGGVFLPFLLRDAPNAVFWMATFHGASTLSRAESVFLKEAFLVAPWFVPLLAVAVLSLRARGREVGRDAVALLVAALAATFAHALPGAPYGGYVTPFVPVALAAGVLVMSSTPSAGPGWREALLVLSAVVPLAFRRPAVDPGPLADLERASALLQSRTPPGSAVLTSMPETAVASNRRVVPGLEMGKFGFTDEMPEEAARARHLLSRPALVALLTSRQPAAVVLSTSGLWNFSWSVPSLKPTSAETRDAIRGALDSGWDLAYAGSSYLVYLPRRAPPGPRAGRETGPDAPFDKMP